MKEDPRCFHLTCTDRNGRQGVKDKNVLAAVSVSRPPPSPHWFPLVSQYNLQPCKTKAWRRDSLGFKQLQITHLPKGFFKWEIFSSLFCQQNRPTSFEWKQTKQQKKSLKLGLNVFSHFVYSHSKTHNPHCKKNPINYE